jgi:RNA polymerase sigma-70 factor, ECF subfamily
VVVILRDLEGLSYQEIADLLSIPVGTVKSRINFGKRLLKEKLRTLLEDTQ